mgnify:CR=1 FL=1
MFKWYGISGIILILFVEVNFFLKIEPYASRYFIIVWLGYILVVDALIYKLRKKSLLKNNPYKLAGIFLLSMIFWWIFEFINLRVGNWSYNASDRTAILINLAWKTIYYSTLLPAFFETYELIRCIHLFDKVKLHKKHKITKHFLYTMMFIGFVTFILPLLFPNYFYPLIWLTFFFLLDPINYLHKKPSIIGHLKDKKLAVPLSLLLAGITIGFLWEFWNYWAVTKWHYKIPFLDFFRIFEMPILGYLGYFPFAFELYAMYFFVESLFQKKEDLYLK